MSVMSSDEEWMPVVGYEGHYEVSSLGRVRSVGRTVEWRGFPKRLKGVVLSENTATTYTTVILSMYGVRATPTIHSLVLRAFHGPKPYGAQARHMNGDKRCNWVSNLSWGTSKENGNDKVIHGTSPRGERNVKAKMTVDTVKAMRKDRRGGMTTTALGEKYGVGQPTASAICLGKLWSFVEGE